MYVKELIDRLSEEDPMSVVYNVSKTTGNRLTADDIKIAKDNYIPATRYRIEYSFDIPKVLKDDEEDKLFGKVYKYIERTFGTKNLSSVLTTRLPYEQDVDE